ncbi:unnamed protein product, partial [Musa acuminata subsp. burmannicoides]
DGEVSPRAVRAGLFSSTTRRQGGQGAEDPLRRQPRLRPPGAHNWFAHGGGPKAVFWRWSENSFRARQDHSLQCYGFQKGASEKSPTRARRGTFAELCCLYYPLRKP